MKFIYISKYASCKPYGIETRHFYLSRELVKLGHDITLYISNANHHLSEKPEARKEDMDGIQVEWIETAEYEKAYGFKRILSWFDFERKIKNRLQDKSDGVDVIIVSSLSLLSVLNGIKYKRRNGAKLVFEVRDIWPLVLERISNVSKFNPFFLWLRGIEKKGYKNADVVVGTMPNLKEHVFESIQSEKKVLWIPHCINPSVSYNQHSKTLTEIRATYNKVACYAGSVNRSCGLASFLEAADNYRESMAFVVLGEGPMLKDYKESFSGKNVFFIPKLKQEDVVSVLKECDILFDGYLQSDIYKYGSSRNKYVEYCLAAKPMIIAYHGFPLFVETYKCGLVVDPESTKAVIHGLDKLLNTSEEELKKMGQNALNFANENLLVAKQVDQLLKAINV